MGQRQALVLQPAEVKFENVKFGQVCSATSAGLERPGTAYGL
jgi:hypothetical protein